MRMRRRRRGRSRLPSKHLTISATDDEWETVRSYATRRRQSIARYLVGLATKDAAEGNEGPPLVLDTGQLEILDSHREILSLLDLDDNAQSLIADIQVRIEAMFNLWAQDMMERGREHDLHAEFVRIVGEEPAATVMASIGRNTRKRPHRRVTQEPEPDLFS